ncbi:MAG: hypothetical protein QOC96_2861 [Acidobacteriota bacterium]|nr:hypothetical protein [Acidobacteriota bacterium]
MLLQFVGRYEITSIEQLNSFKGRALLDVPLWKLLETEGKYGGRYISEGVRSLELKLGQQVNKTYGSWPEDLLKQHLGLSPVGRWMKKPEYCCQLEHVSERAKLINLLLKEPERAQEILDQCLIGCVVLKSEHERLGSADIEPHDPWRRYRQASPPLRVWDRQAEEWLSLEPL